ncbi:hypothetical protein HJC23_009073 [Cyclotella cryptica]|uniref:AB hydrolase-1 domain-containing protein n=1 Tax=Cyclotella cryptica TaxID=29204 RepID=A0ABD3R030_9STRA
MSSINGVPRRPSENPRRYRSPSEYDIPFETHLIPCRDGVTIHSWLLYHPSGANQVDAQVQLPTILFFHGNAGSIGLRLPNAHQMHHYLHANVWLIEYRGYGDSDGVPSEAGLKLDAEAVWDYIIANNENLRHVDPRKVFVFGRSLGGAVALHLARYAESRHYDSRGTLNPPPPLPAGILVENTFTCISDMVDHLLPIVAPLKSLVLRISWDSFSIVPKLTVPTLFLAGAKDTLVPHEHMLRLYRERKAGKVHSVVRMHIVKDGTHNETWMQGGKEYWMAIQSFLREALFAHSAAFPSAFAAERPPSSNNSINMPVQRKITSQKTSSTLPGMSESSISTSTTMCQTESKNTEIGMGGEDAAEMISSVGNFMGMAREALKSSSTVKSGGVAIADSSSGGGAYKKRD